MCTIKKTIISFYTYVAQILLAFHKKFKLRLIIFVHMWSFKTKSNEWVFVHYGHILIYHYNDPISLTPSVQLAETLEREFESTINTTHKRWLLFEKMCEDRRQKVTQLNPLHAGKFVIC